MVRLSICFSNHTTDMYREFACWNLRSTITDMLVHSRYESNYVITSSLSDQRCYIGSLSWYWFPFPHTYYILNNNYINWSASNMWLKFPCHVILHNLAVSFNNTQWANFATFIYTSKKSVLLSRSISSCIEFCLG